MEEKKCALIIAPIKETLMLDEFSPSIMIGRIPIDWDEERTKKEISEKLLGGIFDLLEFRWIK